ncbi:MAG: inorganic phosphate transporter [Phycisphaerae bacterium]|nr:inorganic phosphate transporter [Phycisphaerae bacterium]
MEVTILLVIAVLAGFYMAWNIGANDVANAFGTSVGSGALTLKKAILLAAVFEFCGAFFVGQPVAKTISGEIVSVQSFSASPDSLRLLGIGMLAALVGSSLWLNVATFFGQPVSTTHAIIGAVVGFAILGQGPGCVHWYKMGKIVASWVVSPLFGAVLAYAIYRWGVRKFVLRSRHPVLRTRQTMPVALGGLVAIVTFSIIYRGLPGLRLDLPLRWAAPLSLGVGLAVFAILYLLVARSIRRARVPLAERMETVERWFAYMQIFTACYMSFAHGANDVANAIGPLATTITILRSGGEGIGAVVGIPPWLLAFGAVGIVVGLATYGHKVIESVGKKITEMTPTRGFCAEFGTATSVLVFSKLGMPISTTFVIVGAVMGVGVARGFAALDLKVIRRIFASWVITIPLSAVLSAGIFLLLRLILGL